MPTPEEVRNAQREKDLKMFGYTPSYEENNAMNWCINNGIYITPTGSNKDPKHWFIEISTDRGNTWTKSPHKYNELQLWIKLYEYYMWYYKKNNE